MGSRAKSRGFLRAVAERAPRFIVTTNLAATVSPSIAFVVRVYNWRHLDERQCRDATANRFWIGVFYSSIS